jgi:hypothetical protein
MGWWVSFRTTYQELAGDKRLSKSYLNRSKLKGWKVSRRKNKHYLGQGQKQPDSRGARRTLSQLLENGVVRTPHFRKTIWQIPAEAISQL